MKKPLIIFIAETNHADISYPEITEKIIKRCDDLGLEIKVFSEFGNKEKGWGSEDEKSIAGYFTTDGINQTVNQRAIPIGSVFDRFTKLIPQAQAQFRDGITPSEIYELRKEFIDNPETEKLMELEMAVRKQIGMDVDGMGFWIEGNSNAFVQKTTHEIMAQDAKKKLNGQEDVLIIIAGASHIYGLNKELVSTFDGSVKLVVGNFEKFTLDPTSLESIENAKIKSGEKSCKMVGDVVGFDRKKIQIPEVVNDEILKQAQMKRQSIDALDLDQKPSASPEKSHVEKMIGKSKGGSREV